MKNEDQKILEEVYGKMVNGKMELDYSDEFPLKSQPVNLGGTGTVNLPAPSLENAILKGINTYGGKKVSIDDFAKAIGEIVKDNFPKDGEKFLHRVHAYMQLKGTPKSLSHLPLPK